MLGAGIATRNTVLNFYIKKGVSGKSKINTIDNLNNISKFALEGENILLDNIQQNQFGHLIRAQIF